MARIVPPDPQLGAALRRLRDRRGWSQEDVAHRAGLTLSAYGKIERAETAPAWGTVRDLAAAFDMSIAELAAEVEKEPAA